MPAKAPHAHRPAFADVDNDADTAFQDEVHRSGGRTLPGKCVASLELAPPASFGQPVGMVSGAECLCEPGAQRWLIGGVGNVRFDNFLLAGFESMIEVRYD